MDFFDYKNDHLYAEDVPVAEIAKHVGSPFYCYSAATLKRHFEVFASPYEGIDALVCFAVKACCNGAVLRTLAQAGAGADVVSGGELHAALKAGIPAEKIIFSGVGKTADELVFALNSGIRQINVESEPELERLDRVAQELGKKAPIAFRVNPDVEAGTHAKISTGKSEHKFGIAWKQAHALYKKAAAMDGIQVQGIDVHIGSQLTDLEPFRKAFLRLRDLVETLRQDGINLTTIDLGGGLGIPYQRNIDDAPPLPAEYGQVVRETMEDLGCTLILEPGRLIAGNAGILVSEVVYVKETDEKTFVIIDAAMNDLIRPALYQADHDIMTETAPPPEKDWQKVDIVGPVCETGDTFSRGKSMPPLKEKDLIAFTGAGAYGAVMSSMYNSRPLVPEVMVNGDKFAVIRRRPTYDEMTALEKMPDWLTE